MLFHLKSSLDWITPYNFSVNRQAWTLLAEKTDMCKCIVFCDITNKHCEFRSGIFSAYICVDCMIWGMVHFEINSKCSHITANSEQWHTISNFYFKEVGNICFSIGHAPPEWKSNYTHVLIPVMTFIFIHSYFNGVNMSSTRDVHAFICILFAVLGKKVFASLLILYTIAYLSLQVIQNLNIEKYCPL